MHLAAGTRLGPYEILNAIGAGGIGEVYRARDTRLGRDVAVKVLPEAFAQDSERVARFEREAKIVARLNHPNILAIFDGRTSHRRRWRHVPRHRTSQGSNAARQVKDRRLADAEGPIDHIVTGGGWFPDGRRVLVCGNEASKPARCYEQNISGGLPRPVTPDGVIGFGVALSPDGARLLAQEPDQIWKLVSLHDSTLSAASGLRTDDFVAGWSSDGRAVFAASMGRVPSRLDRVELETGKRTLLTELAPPDRAGVVGVLVVSVVDDGRGYAYDYSRVNSTLFLVEGLNIPH